MKVAVVHDRFVSRGGSERVAMTIAKTLDAPVYTALYDSERTFEECGELDIRNLGGLSEPGISQAYPLVRMLDAAKFSGLKELGEYELVWLSGQWAHFAGKNNPSNILYCHSPPRFLYDLRKKLKSEYSSIWKLPLDLWTSYWTKLDQKAIKDVGKIVANSENVKDRVKRYYGRDARVIYPPVDVEKFRHESPCNYFLSVNRIAPAKRVHLQLDSFEKLPHERLLIVGKAEYGTEYQKRIEKRVEGMGNVEWKGSVGEKELIDLYARCKGVIQTAMDEDFGYVPLESMAAGKPCLAVNEGGFRESIVNGRTGVLVDEPYVENFVKAIENFNPADFEPNHLQEHAERFSEERFVSRIKELSNEVIQSA